EAEHARGHHRLQTNDAGRGFFSRADDFVLEFRLFLNHGCDDVRTIVDDDVRAELERGLHVTAVGVGRFAFDGEHRNAVIVDETSRHIILSRKWIRSDQQSVSAARLECPRKIRGLSSDVRTGYQAYAFERLLVAEALTD